MFLEGLSMLGFDNSGSNSAQESSPNEESDDSIDDFSAKKQYKEENGSKRSVSYPYGSRKKRLNNFI